MNGLHTSTCDGMTTTMGCRISAGYTELRSRTHRGKQDEDGPGGRGLQKNTSMTASPSDTNITSFIFRRGGPETGPLSFITDHRPPPSWPLYYRENRFKLLKFLSQQSCLADFLLPSFSIAPPDVTENTEIFIQQEESENTILCMFCIQTCRFKTLATLTFF